MRILRIKFAGLAGKPGKSAIWGRTLNIFLSLIFLSAFNLPTASESLAQNTPLDQNRERFENGVTAVAQQYIGTPYGRGGLSDSGGLDNSHLFHLIYEQAAQKAGLGYLGYAPMKKLLERTVEVPSDDIRIGDLILLHNGLAAMIYSLENGEKIDFIYVSRKRQRVVSFNNQNLVYDVYWLKNIKGFYRLAGHNFFPNS